MRDERVFLSLVFVIGVAALAFFSFDEVGDVPAAERTAARNAVVVSWVLAAAVGILYQLWLWVNGRLILRDPRDRAENHGRITRALPVTTAVMIAVALAVGALTGPVKGVLFGMFGGFILSITPVMLYIAFRLRPDQRRGEYL